MKSATVYRRSDGWYIHSYSQTTVGAWIAAPPYLKRSLDDDPTIVGEAILSALEASAGPVPHPVEWKGIFQPMLALASVRSWTAFAQGAVSVSVEADDAWLVFEPNKDEGPRGGYTPLPDKIVRIPRDARPDTVYGALFRAVSLCE